MITKKKLIALIILHSIAIICIFNVSTAKAQVVHDVAVTNVQCSLSTVVVGTVVPWNATVENQGTETESFWVTPFHTMYTCDFPQYITLNEGESIILQFHWNTSAKLEAGLGAYQLIAKADIVPGETDTADNVFYGPWVTVEPSVGGILFSVDKLALLAPYIGLTSTAMIGAVATVVYVKQVKRRKEKQ